MTGGMQPRMPAVARQVWHAIPSRLAQRLSTIGTALRPEGRRRIPPQPLHYAALERPPLRVGARQSAVVLGDAGALVEEYPPVLGRPVTLRRSEQGNNARLVTPYGLQHPGCGFPVRIEDQISALDAETNTVLPRQAKDLDRAHIRAFQ